MPAYQNSLVMKALTLHGFDGISSLRLSEVALPALGAADVLVAVHAASVNPADLRVAHGRLQATAEPALPHVPGRDFSGVVVEVGDDARGIACGDQVFGVGDIGRWGTHAEYAVVPARWVAPRPAALPHSEAAALPLAALSAWAALATADLHRGQKVLIQGAGGGVGSIALQLAARRGVDVLATARAALHESLRSLGARSVADPRELEADGTFGGSDVVIDLVGGDLRRRCLACLKRGGTLVHLSVPPMGGPPPRDDVTVRHARVQYDGAILARIAALVEDRALRPVVDAVYSFQDAIAAYGRLARGGVAGKVVLAMGGHA